MIITEDDLLSPKIPLKHPGVKMTEFNSIGKPQKNPGMKIGNGV